MKSPLISEGEGAAGYLGSIRYNAQHQAALRRRMEHARDTEEQYKWDRYLRPTGTGFEILRPLPQGHLRRSEILFGATAHTLDLQGSVYWMWGDLLAMSLEGEPEPSSVTYLYQLVYGQIPESPSESMVRSWIATSQAWPHEMRRAGKGASFWHHRALNWIRGVAEKANMTQAEASQAMSELLDLSVENGWGRPTLVEQVEILRPDLCAHRRFRNGGYASDREEEERQAAAQEAFAMQENAEGPGQPFAFLFDEEEEETGQGEPAPGSKEAMLAYARSEIGQEAEIIALPKPSGFEGLLIVSGGNAGFVRQIDDGYFLSWYEDTEPIARWVVWAAQRYRVSR